MAQVWTHWLPDTPTSLAGSAVAGGDLTANTTYYLVVLAVDTGSSARTTVTNWSKNIFSAYSSEISVTTTTTDKQIDVTFDKVYKADGVTEVDGYIVLVSKTPNIEDLPDASQIFSSSTYYYASTTTNSYSVTANPTYYFHNVKDGLPYVYATSSSVASNFDEIAAYLESDPSTEIFVKRLTSFDGETTFGYIFLAAIYFNVGNTTEFKCYDKNIFVYGSLHLWGKANIVNSHIFLNASTHSYGSLFFGTTGIGFTFDTSSFKTRFGLSTFPTGKTWGASGQFNGITAPGNGDKMNGSQVGFLSNASIAPTTQTNPYEKIITTPSVVQGGLYEAIALYAITDLIKNGGKRDFITNDFLWHPSRAGGQASGLDCTNTNVYYQGAGQDIGQLVDCFFRYTDFTGYGKTNYTGEGFDHAAYTHSTYAVNIAGTSTTMLRTIRVTVIDENGDPIENAKVSFLDKDGNNLTKGNDKSNVTGFTAGQRDTSYNYDASQVNFQIDETDVWIAYHSWLGGAGSPTTLTPGKNYWYKGEKFQVVQKYADAPPAGHSYWSKYEVIRGLDGTVKNWFNIVNYEFYPYCRIVEAPDYHLTDSNGKTLNQTLLIDYFFPDPVSSTGFIDSLAESGVFQKKLFTPITVRIEKDGYQTKDTLLSHADLESVGALQFNLTVKLEKAVDVVIAKGEIAINTNPSDSQSDLFV